jgi:hypothetical protein
MDYNQKRDNAKKLKKPIVPPEPQKGAFSGLKKGFLSGGGSKKPAGYQPMPASQMYSQAASQSVS